METQTWGAPHTPCKQADTELRTDFVAHGALGFRAAACPLMLGAVSFASGQTVPLGSCPEGFVHCLLHPGVQDNIGLDVLSFDSTSDRLGRRQISVTTGKQDLWF